MHSVYCYGKKIRSGPVVAYTDKTLLLNRLRPHVRPSSISRQLLKVRLNGTHLQSQLHGRLRQNDHTLGTSVSNISKTMSERVRHGGACL